MLHLAVCYGFLWILMDSLGFFGIPWDSLEFLWILWNSHVFFGILWDSLHTMGEIASIGFKSQLFLNSHEMFTRRFMNAFQYIIQDSTEL